MVFSDTGDIISGGNFHGEYPAKVSLPKCYSLMFTEIFALCQNVWIYKYDIINIVATQT